MVYLDLRNVITFRKGCGIFLALCSIFLFSMSPAHAQWIQSSQGQSWAHSNGEGQYQSNGSSVGNSGDYISTINNGMDNSGSIIESVTEFSNGNEQSTFGSPCSSCTSTTYSYSNGDGTYNTVTTWSDHGGVSNSSGNSSGPSQIITTCPSGFTYIGSSCCPNGSVYSETVGSGKGATTQQACRTVPPPPPPANCSFGGAPVASGDSRDFFNQTSVPYGQTCQSTSRQCIDGTWKGDTAYDATSCTVQPPKNCTLDGITVDHGGSYTFFNQTSVPYGQTCSSEIRSCSNGTLSGDPTYKSATCVVNPPPVTGITITATPSVVRYGNTSTLIWNIGNADSCTVSGPLLPATSITVTKNGSTAISNIESQSTYTLNCVLGPKGNQSTGSASTTIQVLPSVQET